MRRILASLNCSLPFSFYSSDAEIIYLENRERDQIEQLDAITRLINKTDQLFRESTEQLQTLQYINWCDNNRER